MANCWVCRNRVIQATDEVAVGCCIRCHVHACNDDGDRLQKSEFWCVICLQWAVVDGSGMVTGSRPGDHDTGPDGPTLHISDPDAFLALAPRLQSSLQYEFAEAAQMWSATADGAIAVRRRGVSLDLLRLATALAIRAVGGSAEILELARSSDPATTLPMVHPALAETLVAFGPTIA
jgi:hypothetical protein